MEETVDLSFIYLYFMKHIIKNITIPYFIILMYYLGIGFISGAMSHIFLWFKRNVIMASIGIVLFVIGALLNEIYIKKTDFTEKPYFIIGKLILYSFIFSLGIGMVSGWVQHFLDVPKVASVLIPLWITLSLFAYVLKEEVYLSTKDKWLFVWKVFIIVVPLAIVLYFVAQSNLQFIGSH